MLLAVLEKRLGMKMFQKDVFLNFAGGFRVADRDWTWPWWPPWYRRSSTARSPPASAARPRWDSRARCGPRPAASSASARPRASDSRRIVVSDYLAPHVRRAKRHRGGAHSADRPASESDLYGIILAISRSKKNRDGKKNRGTGRRRTHRHAPLPAAARRRQRSILRGHTRCGRLAAAGRRTLARRVPLRAAQHSPGFSPYGATKYTTSRRPRACATTAYCPWRRSA